MAALDFGPIERAVDVVFLHATGFNALTYRHVLASLAKRYRVLAIDQRGHGASSLSAPLGERHDWLGYRDDLLAALEALDLSDVTISGHSMGGTVSLLAAAQAPDRVRRLVLFDPVIPPAELRGAARSSPMVQAAARRRAEFPSRADALNSYRGRGAFKTWPEAMLADYVAAAFRDLPSGHVTLACDPAWEASTYAGQGHDLAAALARSRCPIDIFKADLNSTCHLGALAQAAELASRVHIETVAGASHFLPMERPDIVQAALRGAIENGAVGPR